MNIKSKEERKMKKIAKKAVEIAEMLGYTTGTSDNPIRSVYGNDGLTIDCNYSLQGGCVTISLDDMELFKYDFCTEDTEYIDGKWTEIIEILHDNIPNILQEEENKKTYHSLRKYFDNCAAYINNLEYCGVLKSKLGKNNLSIAERTGCDYNDSDLCGEFYVVYNRYAVASFGINSSYEVIKQEIYKYSDWTDKFEKAVTETSEFIVNLSKEVIANKKADEYIKKLRKKYK